MTNLESEMLAMLERLEFIGDLETTSGDKFAFCPICQRLFNLHTDDCELGNLLAKVRAG